MFFYNESDSEISNVEPPTSSSDPHFSDTSLLLKMDSDFSDSSLNNVVVTQNGGISINSAEYKYGGGSSLFTSTKYLVAPNFSGIQLGTEDFTMEAWVKQTSAGSINLFGIGPANFGSYAAAITDQGALYQAVYGQSVGTQNSATGLVSLNTWHHVAFVRSSGTLLMFLDGNQVYSAAYAASIVSADLNIGALMWGSATQTGEAFVDDVRITKGVARYTANFTPPTEAHPTTGPDPYFYNTSLLLKVDSDFTDSSVNSHTVTTNGATAAISTSEYKYGGGSAFLDRFDHLTIPTSEDLQFGTGDFTIECWTKLEQNASPYPAIYSNYNSWQAGALGIYAGNGTDKYTVALNPTHPVITSTTTIQYNDWVHVALTRESGVMRLFINGNLEGSYNSSATLNGVGPSTWIGTSGDVAANGGTTGYFDDFRITKGVARYTTNFTPPGAHSSTGPAEIVAADLQLHLDAGDTSSYSGTGTDWLDLSGNGNDAVLVSSPTFTTTAGGEFSGFGVYGSGGYARIPHNSSIAPTSQITFSAWAHLDDWSVAINSGPRQIASKTQTGGYSLGVEPAGAIGTARIGSSYKSLKSLPSAGWHNVAYTYDGATVTLYIDGVIVATTAASGNISYSASNALLIGREAGSGTTPQSGFDFPGKVATFMLYDRGLTSAEVLQNFEATKSRFGF